MYEEYYGLVEKPFSLTPDPRYLYKSESHASAFELLQYAIRRREGFVVVSGDIGTGKTTLCRALLEQIDRKTFSALVLNPFLSEEDLLKLILQDFGIVSREDVKSGRLSGVSKQELIETIYDFLLSLLPLHASAVLIIDEAQNLPLQVLEQIRILSNLETDKEKLLQIVLVGQLNLNSTLRSPELRQLDQRVSIRYELKPLTQDEVAAYVSHRLSIAGGSSISFEPKGLRLVHKLSSGIPRLVNLICDRALLAAYSVRTNLVTTEIVQKAGDSLDIQLPRAPRRFDWFRRKASVLAAALIALGVSLAIASSRGPVAGLMASADKPEGASMQPTTNVASTVRHLPSAPAPAVVQAVEPRAPYTIVVASLPWNDPSQEQSAAKFESVTQRLASMGYEVYHVDVDLGSRGRWRRVLAGAYERLEDARRDEARLTMTREFDDTRAVRSSTVGVGGVR